MKMKFKKIDLLIYKSYDSAKKNLDGLKAGMEIVRS